MKTPLLSFTHVPHAVQGSMHWALIMAACPTKLGSLSTKTSSNKANSFLNLLRLHPHPHQPQGQVAKPRPIASLMHQPWCEGATANQTWHKSGNRLKKTYFMQRIWATALEGSDRQEPVGAGIRYKVRYIAPVNWPWFCLDFAFIKHDSVFIGVHIKYKCDIKTVILTMPLLPEPKNNKFQNLILSCRAWNCCLDVRIKYKMWYKSSIKLTVTLLGWPQLKEVWGAGLPLLTSYLPIIICTTTPIA